MSYCFNLRILKEFCKVYFTKLLADYRIPTNFCIYQRLWTFCDNRLLLEAINYYHK